MSHHHISQEELIALVTGKLPPKEAARIADQAAPCPECRMSIARLEKLRTLILEDDSQAPPLATLHRAQAIFRRHGLVPVTQPGWRRTALQMLSLRIGRLAIASTLGVLLVAFALVFTSLPVVTPIIQASLPGDAFYPVKTALEDVRVATLPDEPSRIQAQLEIAETRVIEINALVDKKRFDLIDETTRDYSLHVQQATTSLEQVLKRDPQQVPLAKKAEQDLSHQLNALTILQDNTPEVSGPIKEAVIASNAAKSSVQNQLATVANPPAVPTPSPEAATETAAGTETSTADAAKETPPVTTLTPAALDPSDSATGAPSPEATPTLPPPTEALTATPPVTATETSIPVTGTVSLPTEPSRSTPTGTPSPPASAPSITPETTLTDTLSPTPLPSETPTIDPPPSLESPTAQPTPTSLLPSPAPAPSAITAPTPTATVAADTPTPSARRTRHVTETALPVTGAPSETSTAPPADPTDMTGLGASEPMLAEPTLTSTPGGISPFKPSRLERKTGTSSTSKADISFREQVLERKEVLSGCSI